MRLCLDCFSGGILALGFEFGKQRGDRLAVLYDISFERHVVLPAVS